MKRVAITGSRYGLNAGQKTQLIDMLCGDQIDEFHFGDCVGVDTEALWLAVELGAGGVLHSHPATMNPEWDAQWRAYSAEKHPELGIIEHEPKHPLERNVDMVEAATVLWAFPQGSENRGGTWWTIRYARRSGLNIVTVH